jgi:hypothetical protein
MFIDTLQKKKKYKYQKIKPGWVLEFPIQTHLTFEENKTI